MPYVIAEPCVGTMDRSCVDVCPVDCIHPTPGEPGFEEADQLHVEPAECIDCDACATACPVNAIFPVERLPERWAHYAAVNADWYAR